jgi:2-polyprenyl-6-methoxyphenol hydroxylase-like FAD-dependent oxidoreductase
MIRKIYKKFSNSYYDIVISGCGPTGLALASALSKSIQFENKSILMIDQKI